MRFFNWGRESSSVLKSVTRPKILISRAFISYKRFADKGILEREYVENQKSTKQIASELGTHHSVVLKYLKAHGIAIREAPLSHYRKAQTGYGRKVVNGRELRNRKESEIIEKMQKLREQGISYWKIADVLNAWGIPTKTRKGLWSARQVHQIVKRVEKESVTPKATAPVFANQSEGVLGDEPPP